MQYSERYLRQVLVEDWGEQVQNRIESATVGIAGTGGLGSPVATYLAAAGVGRIVLCDYQELELSNLNRQVMHKTRNIGRPKVESAAEFLGELNPEIEIVERRRKIDDDNVDNTFEDCDLIVDCLDNWETRFVLNRFVVRKRIGLVHGGTKAYWGQFALLKPPETACLACFLEPVEEEPGPIPVIGAVVGSIGCLMAQTALGYLGGTHQEMAGEMRFVDTETMNIEGMKISKRDDCPVCGNRS